MLLLLLCHHDVCRAAGIWRKIAFCTCLCDLGANNWQIIHTGDSGENEDISELQLHDSMCYCCFYVIVFFVVQQWYEKVALYLSLWSGYGLPIICKDWSISDRNLSIAKTAPDVLVHISVDPCDDIPWSDSRNLYFWRITIHLSMS